ncbi:MAG: hypothetical protein ACKOUT_09845 [Novosphingobium sp.]
MKKPALILAAIAMLPLAACSKKPETQAQAGGEILEGSISDAMLPLDTATSQPPLAPKSASTGRNGDDKDAAEEDRSDPAAKADASTPKAPAAEPE